MVLACHSLHGALNTDLQAVAGKCLISAAGMQKVGIAGGQRDNYRREYAAGTAPGNGLAILSVYNNTPRH